MNINFEICLIFACKVGTKFIALEDFDGEQEGDLAFKAREQLTYVGMR